MIRTIVTPEQQDISISLPENFIGRQVEVIVFALDEALQEPHIMDKPLTHFASEHALAKDWLTEEEDAAWQNL